MPHFEGILLDLDNTLYNYEITHNVALEEAIFLVSTTLLEDFATIKKFFELARIEINSELKETAASHNRLLYFQRMFELMELNPLDHSLQVYQCYWDKFIEHLKVFEHVYDFLESVQEKKICILTDLTAHIQFRKIKKLGLDKYCRYMVTSEEAGREKPHPYMFLLAAHKLGLSIDRVCMIGDNYEKDILGAKRVGIEAFWFNPENKQIQLPVKVNSFTQYSELMELIK